MIKSIVKTEETDHVKISEYKPLVSEDSVKEVENKPNILMRDDYTYKRERIAERTTNTGGSLLNYIIDQLGIDRQSIPFQIWDQPTGYAVYWDSDKRSIIKFPEELCRYELKNIKLPVGFYTLLKMLHPTQKKEFLQDIWDMIIESDFKYICDIQEEVGRFDSDTKLIIRGILRKDYDQASGVNIKDLVDKIVEKYKINPKEMITNEDLPLDVKV